MKLNAEHASDLCDLNVTVIRTTPAAALVTAAFRDTGEPVWVPLSQVELSINDDGTYQLTGPSWLMRSKGLL